MAEINWVNPNMGGTMFEAIVGTLMGNRFTTSQRIVPAQGDGGVDVYVPVSDAEVDVYQCKHFTSRMRWQQVEASLKRLDSGKWEGFTVRNWYLVVPKQPTTATLKTFQSKTKGMPFTCSWMGLDWLNNLAIEYPEVYPYYMEGGRDRLKERVDDWANVAQLIKDERSPSLDAVKEDLARLANSLRRDDPHLRYEFSVRSTPPTDQERTAPGIVAVMTAKLDQWYITQFVTEKFSGSASEAEDRLTVKIGVLSQESRVQIQEMLAIGSLTPITLGPQDLGSVSTPELGFGSLTPASTYIELTANTVPVLARRMRLKFSADERPDIVVVFVLDKQSTGHFGAKSRWLSQSGLFGFTSTIDTRSSQLNMNDFKVPELFDEIPVVDLCDDMQLVRGLAGSSRWSFAPMTGNAWTDLGEIDEPLFEPHLLAAIECLRIIQNYTGDKLVVPAEFTAGELWAVTELAALLEGIVTERSLTGQRITTVHPAGTFTEGQHFSMRHIEKLNGPYSVCRQIVEIPDEVFMLRSFDDVVAKSISVIDNGDEQVVWVSGASESYFTARVSCGELDSVEVADVVSSFPEATPFDDVLIELAER